MNNATYHLMLEAMNLNEELYRCQFALAMNPKLMVENEEAYEKGHTFVYKRWEKIKNTLTNVDKLGERADERLLMLIELLKADIADCKEALK